MMILENKTLEFKDILSTLGEIFRGRLTGALRLDSAMGTRVFYIRDGDLISIGTTIDKEKIDEILIRDGKITKEHIKEALEKSNSFAQIGKQLIVFGFLKQQELEEELKKQANFIMYNLLKENDGKISFIEGHEPTRTDIFYYPTHIWLLDFFTSLEERDLIFKSLPPLNHYIGKEPELEEFLEILPWEEEDKELMRKLNGSFTVSEATSYSRKKEMEIYKKLAFLNSFGVIKSYGEVQKKPAQAPLFNPLEVQEEIPQPPPVNVDFPIKQKRHIDKKKKIFYIYPLVGSAIIIILFLSIFIYYGWFSKPQKPVLTSPPKVEESIPEEKLEEESDTMVLTPQKKEEESAPETEAKKPIKTVEPIKEEKETQSSVFYEEASNYLNEARTLPQSHYTVQILIACQEETIKKLKKQYPSFDFWFIPITFQGKPCYKLFYESFKNKEEAQKAKDSLPKEILKDKPQLVPISSALKDAR